eukprot:198995-Amphidinium_carterae.1
MADGDVASNAIAPLSATCCDMKTEVSIQVVSMAVLLCARLTRRQPVGTYACGVPSSVPGKDRHPLHRP